MSRSGISNRASPESHSSNRRRHRRHIRRHYHHDNCTGPEEFQGHRRHHRGQRSCRCLRRRHIRHSLLRPHHTHHNHLPHPLRSCTCPRGCPSRRRPVCKCVCVSGREKERTREMMMITNDTSETTSRFAFRRHHFFPQHVLWSLKGLHITFERSRVYTSHERDLKSRRAVDHHRIGDQMQLNLHAIIYARC